MRMASKGLHFPQLHWQSLAHVHVALQTLHTAQQQWLLAQGSLTQRMQQVAHALRVEVQCQGLAAMTLDESRQLQLTSHRRLAWVREVLIYDQQQVWIWARTVLPLSAQQRRFKRLSSLGDQPIGSVLFSQYRSAARSHFQLARLPAAQLGAMQDVETVWARRSQFQLAAQQSLLVQEIFMPQHPMYTQHIWNCSKAHKGVRSHKRSSTM